MTKPFELRRIRTRETKWSRLFITPTSPACPKSAPRAPAVPGRGPDLRLALGPGGLRSHRGRRERGHVLTRSHHPVTLSTRKLALGVDLLRLWGCDVPQLLAAVLGAALRFGGRTWATRQLYTSVVVAHHRWSRGLHHRSTPAATGCRHRRQPRGIELDGVPRCPTRDVGDGVPVHRDAKASRTRNSSTLISPDEYAPGTPLEAGGKTLAASTTYVMAGPPGRHEHRLQRPPATARTRALWRRHLAMLPLDPASTNLSPHGDSWRCGVHRQRARHHVYPHSPGTVPAGRGPGLAEGRHPGRRPVAHRRPRGLPHTDQPDAAIEGYDLPYR